MRSPRDPAVVRFLKRSTTVRIATLSPAGNPDIIPLWFVVRRGRVCMSARSESTAVRDLRLHPEVVLMFHGERWAGGRALRIKGRAAFRTDRGSALAVSALSALKYFVSPAAIRHALVNRRKLGLRRRYYAERAGEAGIIEVVPEEAEFLKLPG